MGILDIVGLSNMVYLGLILVLLALVSMYLNNKINEQNHRLNAMLELVTTLAQEINIFKANNMNSVHMMPMNPSQGIDINLTETNLINVSDGERESSVGIAEEEDDEESDEDETDDDDEDEDEDEDEESDEENNGDDEDDEDEHDEESDEESDDNPIIDLSAIDEGVINIDNIINKSLESQASDIKFPVLEKENDDNSNSKFIVLSEELHENENENENDDKSQVSLPNPMAHVTTLDYKKMSMNKLKEYAISKGLITESNKMKKNELIKLLTDF